MKILRSHLGKFPLIELRDPDSGAFFSILPTRGATVHRVGLPGPDGAVREVLCPMRTEIEVERHRWAKGAQLAPWPNRIQDARYEFQGKTYAPPRNFKHQGGHAIHGFEMFETTKLGAKDPDAGWLEFQLASKGWPGYPFPIRITHRFSLSPDGFRMETSLRNEGRTDAPAGHGWHPYFRLGKSIKPCTLAIPAGKLLESTPRAVPSGRKLAWDAIAKPAALGGTWLNECVELSARKGIATTRLTDSDLGLSLEVWQEAGPGKYGHLQVFTHPLRHCLAIEPMTCAPNAFNNGMGLLVLRPGEEFRASCGARLVGCP
jgi:aldose 1-epimerase